ncbi:MAG: alpha-ketoacid dehydrogenase subunit beta [Candidatus Omnitrophica bacterium]|nr:alpha-ketoacid dehydrogenase subunit beta [Candidatus Omnitrophota bacterium]
MNRQLTYAQSIAEALVQGMEQDPNVFVFGLGVDDYKGIFGTTRAAFEKFGKARVFDAPASEGALTGVAIGAALNGKRPVLVHARNDFMFLALDQLINNAAKWKYTYNGKSTVPFVTRGIIGKGWGQGPTHSQSIQSIFAHFPGLVVAMPSNAYDIKGIILQSLKVDCPVVILEHRSLYDIKAEVPQNPYTVDFGKANVVREGSDVTIVASSLMVFESLKAADVVARDGIQVEVIDPVTIQPLDEKTILRSVAKTGRLICADTSWLRCGFSAEVAAVVAENIPQALKAPVKRIGFPECPSPVSKALEDVFFPSYRDIVSAIYAVAGKEPGVDIPNLQVVDSFKGPY